jgi:hypothetical protein
LAEALPADRQKRRRPLLAARPGPVGTGAGIVNHPDNLITHLTEDHDIKPWSIMDARSAQEEHHRRLHEQPRKPVNHVHCDMGYAHREQGL